MPLDSTPVLSILDRATDANGAIVPGAILEFYEAGTSTPKTVYSNATLVTSLGTSVTCDAGGYPTSDGSTKTMIYVGTASYKMIVKTSAGVALITHDNIPGAPAIPATEDSALPETPVITRTSTTTITSGNFETYRGRLVNADPSGGSFAIQLPPPVSAGDGWRMGVRLSGSTTNVVTIRASGATIAKPGQTGVTSFALAGLGHTVWISCDGAGFVVDTETPPFFGNATPYVTIADRLTAPPSSPTGGARYIINGTPTGVWSTLGFAEHDIAESDGNGSWIRTTPKDGWLAYVADETLLSQFRVSTWTDLNNITAPSSSNLKTMDLYYDGVGVNTIAANTWTKVPIYTVPTNTITGASHSGGVVTLPTGTFLVMGIPSLVTTTGSNLVRARLYSTTSSATKITSVGVKQTVLTSSDVGTSPIVMGTLVVTAASENFEMQVYSNVSSTVFGTTDTSAEAEKFATLQIISLASQQGPQGAQGLQGPGGLDAALAYQWNSATTGDPGNGKFRVNNATLASLTELAISKLGSDGSNNVVEIITWDDGSSSIKGRFRWREEGSTQNHLTVYVTGPVVDNTTYYTIPASYVSNGGTLTNGADGALVFLEKGDKGDPGTTVPDPSGLATITDFNDETDFVLAVDTSGASATVKTLGKNLGFTAAGTGAALRTLQSKLRDVRVILDRASVDTTGLTDCSTQFANAIAALPADGGELIVPAGKYRLTSSVALDRPVTIRGEGPGATEILVGANIDVFTMPNGFSSQSVIKDMTIRAVYGTCTMTIASPGVVTMVGHGFSAGQPVYFGQFSTLPTGFTAGTVYYVIATGLTSDSFQLSATLGGAAINTSGTQTGPHEVKAWRTSGAGVYIDTVRCRVENVYSEGLYQTVRYGENAYLTWTDRVEVRNPPPHAVASQSTGFKVGITNTAAPDTLWWSNCLVQSDFTQSRARSGWHIESCVTLQMMGCTSSATEIGMLVEPTGIGGVLFSTINQCYFDSQSVASIYVSGVSTASIRGFKVVNSWLCQSLGNGLTIAQFGTATLDGFFLTNCFIHKNTIGVDVAPSAINVNVSQCTMGENGTGLNFQAGASKFQVIGNRIGPVDAWLANGTAINVVAGASDDYVIIGNNLKNNTTAALVDAGTGVNKRISGNLGVSADTFGDVVLTQSTGVLTVSTGDLRVTTAGTNAASAVTVGGTQTLTNKTLTTPVLSGLTTYSGAAPGNVGILLANSVSNGGGDSFGAYGAQTLSPASGAAGFFHYAGGTISTAAGTIARGVGLLTPAIAKSGANNITVIYGAQFAVQTAGVENWSMYSEGNARFGAVVRIDQAASTVGTGTKTISNAADSSTNFGKYFSINLNGTTVYVPCSTVAPT